MSAREELIEDITDALARLPGVHKFTWHDIATATLAAIEQRAAVVPKEPTSEMIHRGAMEQYREPEASNEQGVPLADIWRVMLATSPFAEKPDGG